MAARKRKRKSKRRLRLVEGAILRKLTRTGEITWDDPDQQKRMMGAHKDAKTSKEMVQAMERHIYGDL